MREFPLARARRTDDGTCPSPFIIAAPILAWSPFVIINALRAAIGSCWATATPKPKTITATANTARLSLHRHREDQSCAV
jgi:hypothetical protein